MEQRRKPLTPWGLHPIESWIRDEFDRRSKDYGMNPVDQGQGTYSGPRSAWTRVFSNGVNRSVDFPYAAEMEGFILGGGAEGFNESYGFDVSTNIANFNYSSVVGIDAAGKKHVLKEDIMGFNPDFPNRPPPNVTSVDCELSGAQNSSFPSLLRKIRIEWKCYSLNQLNYLIPYFLTPRITLVVEWGWNNYDINSLANLQNKQELRGIFRGEYDLTAKRIKSSNGNYDVAMGYITDYGYELNENGGYNCYTVITNANYLIEGQNFKNKSYYVEDQTGEKTFQLKNLKEYVSDVENLALANSNVLSPEKFKEKFGFDVDYVKGRIFYPKNKAGNYDSPVKNFRPWLRMDLIAEIINKFFVIELQKSDENADAEKISKLFIDDVIICAHPALKSTDENVLFPNQYAPRFLAVKAETQSTTQTRPVGSVSMGGLSGGIGLGVTGIPQSQPIGGTNQEIVQMTPFIVNESPLAEARREQSLIRVRNNQLQRQQSSGLLDKLSRIVSVEYKNLFSAFISKYKLDDSYDDLYSLINSQAGGKSFPVYTDYTQKDEQGRDQPGFVPSGYWGYLKDVYISVNMLESLVENNYTVMRLLEVLLQKISAAACNISRLKITSPEYANGFYTVRDDNISFIRTAAQANQLLKITLGSINSSYIKTAGFSVKLSSDMSNQLIFQSAQRGAVSSTDETAGKIPAINTAGMGSAFSSLDRLFTGASHTKQIPKSDTSPDNSESSFANERRLGGSSESDLIAFKASDGKEYILFERDSKFLKRVLLDKNDKTATYMNNPIMPGTTFTMELLGISGIRYLSQFTLDHVPQPYGYKSAVWQVTDVKQKIENKSWTTTITAQVRPLSVL